MLDRILRIRTSNLSASGQGSSVLGNAVSSLPDIERFWLSMISIYITSFHSRGIDARQRLIDTMCLPGTFSILLNCWDFYVAIQLFIILNLLDNCPNIHKKLCNLLCMCIVYVYVHTQ